jgi:hypothetical protein
VAGREREREREWEEEGIESFCKFFEHFFSEMVTNERIRLMILRHTENISSFATYRRPYF